jgi:hypothetical protein
LRQNLQCVDSMRTRAGVDVKTTYWNLPLLIQMLLLPRANVWIHEEDEKEDLVRENKCRL